MHFGAAMVLHMLWSQPLPCTPICVWVTVTVSIQGPGPQRQTLGLHSQGTGPCDACLLHHEQPWAAG